MRQRTAGSSGIVWCEVSKLGLRGRHGVGLSLIRAVLGAAPALGRSHGCVVRWAEFEDGVWGPFGLMWRLVSGARRRWNGLRRRGRPASKAFDVIAILSGNAQDKVNLC